MSAEANCSFCAKGSDEVVCLVAGPAVWICNECIDLCAVIAAEHRGRHARANLLKSDLEEILRHGT